MKTITKSIIEKNYVLEKLLEELKGAYINNIFKEALVPSRIMIERINPYAVYGVMPCLSDTLDLFVTKIATLVEKSSSVGSTINGYITAFSVKSGKPIAIFDGEAITNIKCMLITAFVTDLFSIKDAQTLGVIGTGNVAYSQIIGILKIREIEKIFIYGRNAKKTEIFVRKLKDNISNTISISIVKDISHAVQDKDIVCTATTSTEALITKDKLSKSCHVNCMGSHNVNSREISNNILLKNLLIVENKEIAIKEAGLTHEHAFELNAELILKSKDLRMNKTIFSSVGHSLLDTIVVSHLIKKMSL